MPNRVASLRLSDGVRSLQLPSYASCSANWTTFGLRLPVIAPPPILPLRPSARLVRGTEASPPHSSSGSLTSWSLQPMPLRFQLRSLARDFPTQILTRRVVGREPLSHATVMRDSASWLRS